MLNWVRRKVSRKKRRLHEDNFDLDLSYITDNIIAMGFPAQGVEALYRNSYSQVREFLEERHRGTYMIYNLCSEKSRQYDDVLFDSRVKSFPFDDHNPPAFDMIRQFCVSAEEWLGGDAARVIVVHCKAGKGRTGVMIGALLMHMGRYPDCQSALAFYGHQRTQNEKGVTIPSQRRFVEYYEQFLQSGGQRDAPFEPAPCGVASVRFSNVPAPYFSPHLEVEVRLMDDSVIVHVDPGPTDRDTRSVEFNIRAIISTLRGDFRICLMKGGKPVCYMWFNSHWIKDREVLAREEIDKAAKGKKFDDSFTVIVETHHFR
jgi:phosphatidylinositol-3,4,5-trisphosphate 3-phosphatase/dual-specificity protein phosphatase PTEN